MGAGRGGGGDGRTSGGRTLSGPLPTLILSRHDYRSAARANIHFLADEFARRGPTRFASVGFSSISLVRGDPRRALAANRVERRGGVECLLWRSRLHPVALPRGALAVERAWYAGYGRGVPPVLLRWIDEAGLIVIESGIAVSLARLARRRNPGARLIYNASDDLATIGAARSLREILRRDIGLFDRVRLPSALLGPLLPPGGAAVVIPQGFDPALLEDRSPSPYGPGRHAVSIGSMLFDRAVFEAACPAFPEVRFHVIGAGRAADGLSAPNLRVYPTMAHAASVPFIRDADLGIAAYRPAAQPAYLADSSMKLTQFAAFGVPAVCPDFAAGGRAGRIGYVPGDAGSIRAAIGAALARGRGARGAVPSWANVTDRLLAGLEGSSGAAGPL